MVELTRESIEADILKYKARLKTAVDELAGLNRMKPIGYQARTDLEKKQRELLRDISHTSNLLRYAEEALRGLELQNELYP